jgi:hypothetical protein
MDFTPSHRLQSRLIAVSNQAVVACSQPIPVFVAAKRRRGVRHYARCVLRGFHNPEASGGWPYIWTQNRASMECHFPLATKLNYVWLEVRATSPKGATVDVFVDDQLVVDQKKVFGRSTIRCQLPEPRLATSVSLSIRTTTFIPARLLNESIDTREVGIAVQAVVFGKRKTKYRPGTFRRESLNRRIARVIDRWWGRKAA